MRLALPWRSDPAPPPPAAPERYEQASLALEHVLRRLEDSPRPGVLDLGSPMASNVALYLDHRARITFADLYRFYEPVRGNAIPTSFPELVPANANHIDVILAWDLLNYLSIDEIERLGPSMREKCAPGALLFALVACPGPMPATPSYYTIEGREALIVEPATSGRESAPGYSEQVLLRALPDITVKSRFQLRSAMVEYLFTWE